MCRYPPSTIHIYLDLPSTQIIQTHTSHRHNTTPLGPHNTNTPTRESAKHHTQQTSSPDITTVSNTLYNRTSWTTQHALSSDHLPIITTINIRHDYRLQQNQRNNIRRANACDPALKLLNEEITSDIQKHKQIIIIIV